MTFLDGYSRHAEIALMKRKDEVLKILKLFLQKSELLHGKKLKALQSDNGVQNSKST